MSRARTPTLGVTLGGHRELNEARVQACLQPPNPGQAPGVHHPVLPARKEGIGPGSPKDPRARVSQRLHEQLKLDPAGFRSRRRAPPASRYGWFSARHFRVGHAASRSRGPPRGLLGAAKALWEAGKMAAPMRALLQRAAPGWRRRLDVRGAGSLGCRGLASAPAPASSGSPWRLWGALCLQRPPRVSKPLTPLQEEMAELLQQVGPELSRAPREAAERGELFLGIPAPASWVWD